MFACTKDAQYIEKGKLDLRSSNTVHEYPVVDYGDYHVQLPSGLTADAYDVGILHNQEMNTVYLNLLEAIENNISVVNVNSTGVDQFYMQLGIAPQTLDMAWIEGMLQLFDENNNNHLQILQYGLQVVDSLNIHQVCNPILCANLRELVESTKKPSRATIDSLHSAVLTVNNSDFDKLVIGMVYSVAVNSFEFTSYMHQNGDLNGDVQEILVGDLLGAIGACWLTAATDIYNGEVDTDTGKYLRNTAWGGVLGSGGAAIRKFGKF